MALLSLIAKLGLDKTQFEAGLNKAGNKAKQFAASMKAQLAGAFSVAAVIAFARSIEQATGRIKDLASQYGITRKEVQEADFALKQSGLAFEDLGTALIKLGRARRDAVEGNEDLRETLQRYGVALEDINDPQVKTYSLLIQMSRAMGQMTLTAKDQVEQTDLLGVRAGVLVNVLADLEKIKPPAVFSDKDIENIDRGAKAFENLWLQMQVFASPLATKIAKTLESYGKVIGATSSLGERLTGIIQIGAGVIAPNAKKMFNKVLALAKIPEDEEAKANLAAAAAREVVKPGAGGMWEWDKNKKKLVENASSEKLRTNSFSVQSDTLGRIGAFSGRGTGGVESEIKKQSAILKDIKTALTQRGIKLAEF